MLTLSYFLIMYTYTVMLIYSIYIVKITFRITCYMIWIAISTNHIVNCQAQYENGLKWRYCLNTTGEAKGVEQLIDCLAIYCWVVGLVWLIEIMNVRCCVNVYLTKLLKLKAIMFSKNITAEYGVRNSLLLL